MDNDYLISEFNAETIQKTKKKLLLFIILIIILAIICVVFMILYISEKIDNVSSSKEKSPLNLWKNCDSKNKLIDYVKKATKEGSSYFIPKEDRVAVFDFDGTLFQETDPIYMDYKLFKYRVLDDKNYINKATDEQK